MSLIRSCWTSVCILLRSRVFVFSVVGALALGVAANVSVFTVVKPWIRRQLPTRDQFALFDLHVRSDSQERVAITPADYYTLLRQTDDMLDLFASAELFSSLDGAAVHGQFVSYNYLTGLGAKFKLGRSFSAVDPASVIVLSHRSWMMLYAGDPHVVGRRVHLSGKEFQIIGVCQRSFSGMRTAPPDFWIPIALGSGVTSNPLGGGLNVFARLVPGVSLEQVESRFRYESYLRGDKPVKAELVTTGTERFDINTTFAVEACLFLVILVVAMLLPCITVVCLTGARATGRMREIGIRLALGAARADIWWPIAAEGVALAVLTTPTGLFVAWLAINGGVSVLFRMAPAPAIPMLRTTVPEFVFDPIPVSFGAAVSLLSAVLSYVIPTMFAFKRMLGTPKQLVRGTGSSISRYALLSGQVAISVVLVSATGILVQAVRRGLANPIGYDAGAVYSFESTSPFDAVALAKQILKTSWVSSVAFASPTHAGSIWLAQTEIEVLKSSVSSGYFRTMGIGLIDGRYFVESDCKSLSTVAIISENTRKRLWGDGNPLGKLITVDMDSSGRDAWLPSVRSEATVVGVVGDVVSAPNSVTFDPLRVYLPGGFSDGGGRVLIRVKPNQERIRERLSILISAGAPVGSGIVVYSLQDYKYMETLPFKVASDVALVLGELSLFLCAYGVLSTVILITLQRRRDIGIRMALGAPALSIMWSLLGSTVKAVVIGLTVGEVISGVLLGLAIWNPFLNEVARSVWAYVPSVAVLVLALSPACLVPVVRVLFMRPSDALRLD